MSVVFSGSFSGSFFNTGGPQFISLPSGVDWMFVKNQTVSYAAGADTGAEFFWQRGMTQGRGTIYVKTAATNALQVGQIAAGAGFFLLDTTVNTPGPLIAYSAISNATPPVVSVASTGSLVPGLSNQIVRIYRGTGAVQLQAIDFTVSNIVLNTSFALEFMAPIVNAPATGAAARWSVIPFDPYFYPTFRYITNIEDDAADTGHTLVTMSVTHNYTVGQRVRLKVPRVTALAFGSTQLNDVEGSIIATGHFDTNGYGNTITLDIDSSTFSPFAFPLTADPAFTPATVEPVGESTATALSFGTDLLGDATVNQGQRGMLLNAGTLSPAGSTSDFITWIAGKSFNGV